jgi:hypothetical protein
MTKYHAVLFMCNDENRARFVIEGFKEHNPDIPLTVYNGGSPVKLDYDIEYIEGPNLWHRSTRHPPGSFNFHWFEMLFELHEKYDPDYLIFLETDVKVTRKIAREPEYDISGVVTPNGGITDSLMVYDYWDAYIKGENFHEDKYSNWSHKYHTGMGGTALSRNFFLTCKSRLGLVKQCYELIPFHCYQDMILTCFARSCGCTMGDWSEVSDTRGTLRRITDTQWRGEGCDNNAALIHNFKV